jgi:hypothetical protein
VSESVQNQEEKFGAPCMPTTSEGEVRRLHVDHLVFTFVIVSLPHFRISKRFKLERVGIKLLVTMHRICHSHEGSCRQGRSIRELEWF